MKSVQYHLLRYFIKKNFSKSNGPDIDLLKARRFEVTDVPLRVKNENEVSIKTIHSRDIYFISSKQSNKSRKPILYFHGGAYITGLTKMHWFFAGRLAKQLQSTIIIPDYPLAPESTYKDTISFSVELYKELLLEYDSSDISIIGDSCGGGLAMSLSQMIQSENLLQPKQIILLSPWLDLSLCNPDIGNIQKHEIMLSVDKLRKAGEMYSAELNSNDPLISPLYANKTTFPDIHLFIGTYDILRPDCNKFAQSAEEAGIQVNYYEYKAMLHCFMLFPIPEAKAVLYKLDRIIN